MEKKWQIIEEMIELTGENEAYYLSQAAARNIKIRGKMIRSSDGKLYPVLVKAIYHPMQAPATPNNEENLCWISVKEHPKNGSKQGKNKWYHFFLNRLKKVFPL